MKTTKEIVVRDSSVRDARIMALSIATSASNGVWEEPKQVLDRASMYEKYILTGKTPPASILKIADETSKPTKTSKGTL